MATINHDLASPAWVGDGSGSGLDADTLDTISSEGFSLAGHTHVQANITDIASGTVWTSSVDGSGSGLDADVFDGLESGYFSPTGHTHLSTDITNVTGTIWTNSNDGAGSGLDADLLDGYSSSYFSPKGHTHTGWDITSVVPSGFITGVQMPNNRWGVVSKDFAGTSTVNIAKVNVSDEIELGGVTNLPGPIEFPADAGVVTLFDMPIVSAPSGTEESVVGKIGGTTILKFYGEPSGTGGPTTNAKVIFSSNIEPSTTNTRDIGSTTKAFKTLYLSDGTDEWAITIDASGTLVTTKV